MSLLRPGDARIDCVSLIGEMIKLTKTLLFWRIYNLKTIYYLQHTSQRHVNLVCYGDMFSVFHLHMIYVDISILFCFSINKLWEKQFSFVRTKWLHYFKQKEKIESVLQIWLFITILPTYLLINFSNLQF